jgi:integrase
VGWLGAKAGLTVRPHGLRHLAITTALDRSNGDVRAVAKFSRHKDLRALSRYRDNRPDPAGKVAALVAAECGADGKPFRLLLGSGVVGGGLGSIPAGPL